MFKHTYNKHTSTSVQLNQNIVRLYKIRLIIERELIDKWDLDVQ